LGDCRRRLRDARAATDAGLIDQLAKSSRALLLHAWSSTQLVGLLVAASVAERKSADHRGELLRSVLCERGG
jgi:hypothetical protein